MKIVVTEAMPTQSAEASTTEANIPQVVLITGAKSQLAEALLRIAADIGELALNSIANTSANTNISVNTGAPLKLYALSRSQLDITDAANIAAVFDQYRPSWVINCAAYNAVDAAEHDAIEANRVNALGPELLAQQCLLSGARLLHVSSDYVFGGQAVCEIAHAAERAVCDARESGVEQHQNPDLAPNPNPNQVHLPRPFVELDAPNPLSAYGKSKLLGELKVVAVLGDCSTIVRTSWLYGQDGHNFVNTMLNLMRTQPSLQVIADQIGCPTWSDSLAKVIWQLVVQQRSGVFHYSAQGQCSWYEFACEIQRQSIALNLLSLPVVIQPMTSADYAKQALNRGISLAKRPSYSVLSSDKLRSTLVTHNALLMPEQIVWQDWRQQLNCMLRRLS